ncbi:unnamed protein product, partial [Phaeothamnion confervicola]
VRVRSKKYLSTQEERESILSSPSGRLIYPLRSMKMEEKTKESLDDSRLLLCVFYSEFDNVTGPKICFQAPQDFLPADKFDGVSDYVIVGKALCQKLISVHAYGYKIVGHPMCIQDEKYDRNALLFNIAFVFHGEASAEDIEPYHPALRKIAITLAAIEQESQFLFDPTKKERLGTILPQVLAGLNCRGDCAIVLDDANMLNLKLFWSPASPRSVRDHEVPVMLQDPEVLMSLDCDLALQQVIPHIDGVKYAKKISMDAEVDIDVVKRCLRALLYYECVALVPIFPLRVADLLLRHLDVIDLVDHRRLVTFGVVYGLIRRVHRYPVCIKAPPGQRLQVNATRAVAFGYGTSASRQTTITVTAPPATALHASPSGATTPTPSGALPRYAHSPSPTRPGMPPQPPTSP